MSVSSLNKCLLNRTYPLFVACRIIGTKEKFSLVRNKSEVAGYDEELDPSGPIRFSTSRAATWKSKYQNLPKEPENTQQEKDRIYCWTSYACSYAVLVTYLFLRDGNDFDDEMAMPLGKRMLLLQEWQLRGEREESVRNNDDVSEIDEQLQKIYKLRKEYKYD